jgi:NADH-quinone oxidoreductase subunit M
METHLISWIILVPWIGALLQGVLSGRIQTSLRAVALVSSISASLLACVAVFQIPLGSTTAVDVEQLPWVGAFSISYQVGLDGLSAPFFLLVSIVFPLLLVLEWNQKFGQRGLGALLLILQGAFFGAIASRDLFLQFFFWSLTVLPMYFLMGIWGGEKREISAFRSAVMSSVSNGLVLGALVLVFYAISPHAFSLEAFEGARLANVTIEVFDVPIAVSSLGFGLIFVGLAMRMAVWPFHGWLKLSAEESAPSVVVIQSAIVVPLSAFLLMRWSYGVFPDVVKKVAPALLGLGSLSLLMATLGCLAQNNLRGMVVYLRVMATGMTLMGMGSLDSRGLVGAVYQEFVMSLALAGFGSFAGMYKNKVGNDRFRGEGAIRAISYIAPAATVLMSLLLGGLIAVPGTGTFISSALLVIGTFISNPLWVLVIGVSFLFSAYSLSGSGGNLRFFSISSAYFCFCSFTKAGGLI